MIMLLHTVIVLLIVQVDQSEKSLVVLILWWKGQIQKEEMHLHWQLRHLGKLVVYKLMFYRAWTGWPSAFFLVQGERKATETPHTSHSTPSLARIEAASKQCPTGLECATNVTWVPGTETGVKKETNPEKKTTMHTKAFFLGSFVGSSSILFFFLNLSSLHSFEMLSILYPWRVAAGLHEDKKIY